MIKFGERLKELRRQKKLSQTYMGKLLGVTQSSYSLWEKGLREPSFSTVCELADFFDCSADYLLGRTDIPNAYLIEKEKLPVELADSGVKSVVKLGSAALSEEEVEAIRRLLAERPDLR